MIDFLNIDEIKELLAAINPNDLSSCGAKGYNKLKQAIELAQEEPWQPPKKNSPESVTPP
jgi:hypothetical protein